MKSNVKNLKVDLTIVPEQYRAILVQYIPPITVIILNQILLYLIDIASIRSIYYLGSMEKQFTHSRYQFSIFSKAYFYLLMNMLIIPGISYSSATSLYQIVFDKDKKLMDNIPKILSGIYLTDKGN